jgi:NADH-quinone oxidoreductase subunit A
MGFTSDPAAIDLTQTQDGAMSLARIAFLDLLVFFGVILVGFAYLWKRGDLDWVRASTDELRTESSRTWSEPTAESTVPSEPAAV